ncbi:MAG: putative glycoside hydrolase [Terriglobia bacterium]
MLRYVSIEGRFRLMPSNKLIRFVIPALVVIIAAFWLFAKPGKSKGAPESAQEARAALVSHGARSRLDPPRTHAPEALTGPSTAPSGPDTIEVAAHSIPYTVKRGESVASIAWHYLPESVYLRRSDFEEALRRANGLKGSVLKPGQSVVIPGIPDQPILDKPVTVPKDFDARTIYLTGWTAGSARGLDLIQKWKAVGGNAVVFDVKDFDGEIRAPFNHPYAPHTGITIRNLPKYIHWLHSLHMHVIARIALFRDAYLASTYPQFDVRSRRTGKPWLENGKLAWVDPSLPEVQGYDLDLARMAAASGADEIQFDYVRFPAEGDQADALFAFQKDHPEWLRSKIITDFVARAYQELHPKGVLVSLDVFGVMAWARKVDLEHTGQNIAELAHHCDVISPMIYPSHFFHFDGYADPGDAPEHFISESMRRFQSVTQGSGVVLRPWLQGFHWRTKSYSVDYVLTEIRVAAEQGGIGFLFWNADNNYPKPMEAMVQMHNAGDKYFRGDITPKEPKASAAPAAAHPVAITVPTGSK